MASLDKLVRTKDITLSTKVCIVKTMVFQVVTYGCESWTIKKAEHHIIDTFEQWCWRKLLRIPWIARRSNKSRLQEIEINCSLEAMIMRLKLKYFGHIMRRQDSLEKTLMLGKIEGTRSRGQQRWRCIDEVTEARNMKLLELRGAVTERQRQRWIDEVTEATNMKLLELRGAVTERCTWRAMVHIVTESWTRLND
ncbi:Hypothetical predicted protein [Pelobates cultripes]|uniref:Endonuclease-reverse transcriptase n=1 Tax=Pelobates cultripes TaxID=61616 RepID=A0AAD1TL35_PELCU|nr:Hypothetical predicted protein [Pelobates cultripes]